MWKKHNGDRKYVPTSGFSTNKQTGTSGHPLSCWDLAGKKKRPKAYKSIQRAFRAYVQIDCVLNCQVLCQAQETGTRYSLCPEDIQSQRRSRPGKLQSRHTVKSAVLHVNMECPGTPEKWRPPQTREGPVRLLVGDDLRRVLKSKWEQARWNGHSWQGSGVHCRLERPWWASLVAQW